MAKRNWLFTINNPTEEDDPKEWPTQYVTYQLEKGDEGTPHYQGYVEMSSVCRLAAMKKLNPRAHWEPRFGTQDEAIAYCTKEDTRVDGPWEQGEKKQQGKRSDLEAACATASERGIAAARREHPTEFAKYHKGLCLIAKGAHHERVLAKEKEEMSSVILRDWQADLMAKLDSPPDDRKILWYWESQGNVGKSFFAKYLMATKDALVLDCSKKADLTYMCREHTGSIILFNIVRSMDPDFMGHVYGLAESIKDDFVISTKYETQRVPLGKQHVVVFSNQEPDYEKWSEDRYDVVKIQETHNGIGGVSFKGGVMGSNPLSAPSPLKRTRTINPFGIANLKPPVTKPKRRIAPTAVPSAKRARAEESQFAGYKSGN